MSDLRKNQIFSSQEKFSLKSLYDKYKTNNIIVRPDFQRGFVWDKLKSSRIIESILLGVPIPPIYMAENQDDNLIVVDGQQRLLSIFSFMDNLFPPRNNHTNSFEFKLKSLKVLPENNSLSYPDLSSRDQELINNYEMTLIIIKKKSAPNAHFEIFERLNTGFVKLNDQEIRNCVFRGSYNKFLIKLAGDDNFRMLLDQPQYIKRMLDVELVLRFCAFARNGYDNFSCPPKEFLNHEMKQHIEISTDEKTKIETAFKKSVALSLSIFGEGAFKRFIPGNEKSPNGKYEQRQFNKGLFDIIMYGFKLYEKSQIVPNGDAIREELLSLMTNDIDFINAIAGAGTESKDNIIIKFEKWIGGLRIIMKNTQLEPRSFSSEIKKDLYDKNPICAIPECGQQIMSIHDAEVDHIEHYWRGGKTIPENSRLVHRYCNRKRGRF